MFSFFTANILTQSFWRDEAFSVLLSSRSFLDILEVTTGDFSPPLYYIFLSWWMRVFGSGEISVRLMSFLFYILAALTVFFIGKKLYSKREGLLGIGVALLNPFFFYYAFEARMYTLLTLFVGLSFYLLTSKKWFLFVVTTVLGLYTHNFMTFALVGEVITFLILFRKPWQYLKPLILSLLGIFLGYLPWLVVLVTQVSKVTSGFWIEAPQWQQFFTFFGDLFFDSALHTYQLRLVVGILFILLGFFILYRFFVLHIENERAFLALFVFALVPVLLTFAVSYFVTPLFVPRYLIFVAIPFSLFLVVLADRTHLRWLFIGFIVVSFLVFNVRIFGGTNKRDLREKVSRVAVVWDGEPLVCRTILDFFQTKYYAERLLGSESVVYLLSSGVADHAGGALLEDEDIILERPRGNYFYVDDDVLNCWDKDCATL